MSLTTNDILETLIAFETVSRDSNRALIDYVATLLADAGIAPTIIPDESGAKANLYATTGPADRGGVLLSGHTDVVPIEGQNWTKPPFKLTQSAGRLYGRGTADMKCFVASAVRAMLQAAQQDLKTPLHLALSYDEELGCLGVHSLLDILENAPVKPAMCIVGEPTNLAVASGHKGKIALRATCRGQEGHSALAPLAYNAIHLAADFVTAVQDEQANLAGGHIDPDYDVPYSTVHVGKIAGGVALNIVPNLCTVDFEIRNLAEDDPTHTLQRLKDKAAQIVGRANHKCAAIEIETLFSYPGLLTPASAEVVAFVKSLTGGNSTIKVAFGTEGGLFDQRLGIPTVVCGPGSMLQGHKPDEYVTQEQLERCDQMLAALVVRLTAGL